MKIREGILMLLLMLSTLWSCRDGEHAKSASPEGNKDIERISAEIKAHPDNAELWFMRSKIYRSLKKDSLALGDLYKAVQLDSTRAGYHSAIADILFEHKDINGSVQWIKKAMILNPDDPTAHLKIAKLFLFTEEYPKAFTEINAVLRSDVYNAEAYFLKGMCYKQMKDTARAISSFQTAVHTDPKYVDAHLQLALIYKNRKNPIALQYFENIFRADSSNMDALYGQGMFWQDQQKYAEAKKAFRRCIMVDKNYEKSYYNIGWMLLQEDSTEKALRQFDIAVQVKPDYMEAYYNRGLCHEILGHVAEAKADYEQALAFQPDYAPAKQALQRVQQTNKH